MSRTVPLLDPVEFLQPGRRLFIDTNIFMDSDPRRAGALKRLFERGQEAILKNGNPVVVPTKVVAELEKQSRRHPGAEAEERTRVAIQKAGNALTFLEDASRGGLVSKDLGEDSNPYADDLFVRIFERFAGTYEMCLLTRDITLKMRIRLLAHRLNKRLLTAVVTKNGDLKTESDQSLFERGLRKYTLHAANIAEGNGNFKDRSEVAALEPLLADFRKEFGVSETAARSVSPAVSAPAARQSGISAPKAKPFKATSAIKPRDAVMAVTTVPEQGDRVIWESATETGTLVLGALLGRGGEGTVYESDHDTVVKIFDKEHITQHRRAKIELLVGSGLQANGRCIPTARVRNNVGEFVGYAMPKVTGREARTIFNIRKLEKDFPEWTKSDLVDICISFLEEVQYLHSINVILGDLNPKNLMIDNRKRVFIIDADSWQIEGYPCPVGTDMYTSPRMLGKIYAQDLRSMQDELFAVATMLFRIVMTGQFPYMRTGTDGDIVQLIREGNFAFQYEDHNNKDQPDGDWKYLWSHIHKPVKDLFWNTFHKDGKRYWKRPTATEWLVAFMGYKAYLGDEQLSFDPMSNDVRPIRFKAFRRDTPIRDCPNCGRVNAIAGIWNNDDEEYFIPTQCNKCREAAAAARSAVVQCRDCGANLPKNQAKYGRCPACAEKDDERQAQANTLDPARLCARCGKPFITYGNVDWHTRSGKPIPTTHKRGTGGVYPPGCVPSQSAHKPTSGKPSVRTRTPNRPSAAGSSPAPKGFWARIGAWFKD